MSKPMPMFKPMGRPRKPEGKRLGQISVAFPETAMERLRKIAGEDYLANRVGPSGRPSVADVVRRAVEKYLGEVKAS